MRTEPHIAGTSSHSAGRGARVVLSALVAAVLVAGCGSDDAEAPEPVERKDEQAGKVPRLDRGWEEYVNRKAGIAFGRPPGWAAKDSGAVTTVTAPDELVSVTIAVDRTDDALGGEPAAFATQTAELLPGYRKALDPDKAKRFGHVYDGAITEAEGVAKKSGVRQRVRVIVLERKGVAVVTAVIAQNAREQKATPEGKQAQEAIKTLRTRPPS
ncbi:MAG: hypothetical protein M3Y34_01760 [Actinomycetota bacterium]|nr:hypothetical protein [Actinomycetota bacterium]